MNPTKRMLLAMEAAEHRKGWDQPPVVGALLRQPGALAVAQLFGDLPKRHLPTMVSQAAQQLLQAPEATKRLVDSLPGLYGVIGISEGWSPDPDADHAEVDAWRGQGRSLADLPGSSESRLLCALTLTNEMWFLVRYRGQQPQIMRLKDDLAESGSEGDAFLTLRLLLSVLVLHLPDGERYMPKLVTQQMVDIHRGRQGATRPNSSNAE